MPITQVASDPSESHQHQDIHWSPGCSNFPPKLLASLVLRWGCLSVINDRLPLSARSRKTIITLLELCFLLKAVLEILRYTFYKKNHLGMTTNKKKECAPYKLCQINPIFIQPDHVAWYADICVYVFSFRQDYKILFKNKNKQQQEELSSCSVHRNLASVPVPAKGHIPFINSLFFKTQLDSSLLLTVLGMYLDSSPEPYFI